MSSGAGSEDNLPEMAKIDHRHLQMWKWLHSSNAMRQHSTATNTTNTETSLESSMSNSFDFSADMSRSIDSSISSSRLLTSPLPITSFVTPPSTSFAHVNAHAYAQAHAQAQAQIQAHAQQQQQVHDIYSLALPYLQAPPPPYTASASTGNQAHVHNTCHAATLLLLHQMAAEAANSEPQSDESSEEIDVVGLSLNDKEEEEEKRKSDEKYRSKELAVDTPLDLSYKLAAQSQPMTSPSAFRPTVIIDHHSSSISNNVDKESGSSKSHTSVRRSMSSVSSTNTHEDVAAHFRRSLSGKWPKRVNKHEENRNSPLRRLPSFNTHSSISSLSTLSISPTPPQSASSVAASGSSSGIYRQSFPQSSTSTTTTPTPSSPSASASSLSSTSTSSTNNIPKQTIIVNNHCSDTSLSVADHFRRALWGRKGAYDLMKSQKS